MDLAINFSIFLLGLVVLTFGAHSFVHGAVKLAVAFRISQLFIGLTVVAFGTSAPELFLDVTAVNRGSVDLAFGDLVGSNIANIGLILAVAALSRPLVFQMRLLRFELPLVITISAGLWWIASDGEVSHIDGIMMLAAFAGFVLFMFRSAKRESLAVKQEIEEMAVDEQGSSKSMLYFVGGLMALIGGANLMVISATALAHSLGISDLVIGLTIVAIGTSLPELATSIMATVRNQADISVGNVFGSNIFNILFVMGICALIHPLPVRLESLQIDLPVMLGSVVLVGLFVMPRQKLGRVGGALLLICYVAYLSYVWNITK
jgi:cation:H+ antiporter